MPKAALITTEAKNIVRASFLGVKEIPSQPVLTLL